MKISDVAAWNLVADLAGVRDEAEKARIIRQAFEWQRAAERRRIRKAIRYAIAAAWCRG